LKTFSVPNKLILTDVKTYVKYNLSSQVMKNSKSINSLK